MIAGFLVCMGTLGDRIGRRRLLVIGAVALIGSMVAPLVARRVRPACVIAGAALISVAGFLLMTQVQASSGMALVMSAGAAAVVGLSPIGVMRWPRSVRCRPNLVVGC